MMNWHRTYCDNIDVQYITTANVTTKRRFIIEQYISRSIVVSYVFVPSMNTKGNKVKLEETNKMQIREERYAICLKEKRIWCTVCLRLGFVFRSLQTARRLRE